VQKSEGEIYNRPQDVTTVTMAAPLGFNPHLVPESTQKTTRAAFYDKLYASNELEEASEAGLVLLHNFAQRSLGSFETGLPRPKRRKVDAESPEKQEKQKVARM